MRFAIIVSRFNDDITEGLLTGAKKYLEEKVGQTSSSVSLSEKSAKSLTKSSDSLAIDTFYAPGAFEIPLLAKTLAKKQVYSGIICLGAVIKGETAHFEFISLGTTMGIMQAMLDTETPISFGVLTTYTEEQAAERAQDAPTNKGREAAAACLELAESLAKIKH